MSSRRMVQRLVREQMAVFGEFPKFEPGHYTFLLDYVRWGAGDGMEHRNSTSISNPGVIAAHRGRPAPGARHDLARVLPCLERRAHPAGRPRAVRLHAREHHVLPLARRGLHAVLRAAAADARRARPGRADRIGGQRGRQRIGPSGAIGRADERARRVCRCRRRQRSPSIAAARFISYYTYGAADRARPRSLAAQPVRRQADARRLHARALAASRQVRRQPGPATSAGRTRCRSARRARGAQRQSSTFADEFFDKYIEGREVADYATLLAAAGYVMRPANPDGGWIGPLDRAGRRWRHHDREPHRVRHARLRRRSRHRRRGDDDRRRAGDRRGWNALRQRKPGDSVTITIRRRDGKTDRKTLAIKTDPTLRIDPIETTGGELTPRKRRCERRG